MVAQRRTLETLWTGRCTVTVRKERQNPVNKRTEFKEKELYSEIPCRLSFQQVTVTGEAAPAAAVTQTAKLFLAPEISIPPGSKITVTQHNVTRVYQQSGEPAMHANHQEIQLELFGGWA